MCGRYALYGPISRHRKDEVPELTSLGHTIPFLPRYNAAPTQYLPVYRIDPERGRELAPLKWGLIPFWSNDTSIGQVMTHRIWSKRNVRYWFHAADQARWYVNLVRRIV